MTLEQRKLCNKLIVALRSYMATREFLNDGLVLVGGIYLGENCIRYAKPK